jgi:hypothetical protein
LPVGRRRGWWLLVLFDHQMVVSIRSIVTLFTKC